jgi:hypothetical protein
VVDFCQKNAPSNRFFVTIILEFAGTRAIDVVDKIDQLVFQAVDVSARWRIGANGHTFLGGAIMSRYRYILKASPSGLGADLSPSSVSGINMANRFDRWRALAVRALCALGFAIALCAHTLAATFAVTRTDDRNLTLAGCTSDLATADCAIREALTAAASVAGGHTIVIKPGITITLTIPAELVLAGNPLLIQGNGATITRSTAPGTPEFRVMRISTAVNIFNLVVTNGRVTGIGDGGGGLVVGPSVTVELTGCSIIGNVGFLGGGIANLGTLRLYATEIRNNSALGDAMSQGGGGDGGGVYVNTGATLETFSGTSISSNSAAAFGGGVNNFGGTVISRNVAEVAFGTEVPG